ncbi:MAG: hypothetical protein ACREYE_01440 [Gammaproteobacteria bacterium]
MVSHKTQLAGSGVVGLSTASAGIAYLTQIRLKLFGLGIRKLASEASGERRVGVEIQGHRKQSHINHQGTDLIIHRYHLGIPPCGIQAV